MRTSPLLLVALLVLPAADAADPTRLSDADAILVSREGDYPGHSVSGAGDVNGDGKADVLVGAPGYEPGDWSVSSGAAYLLSGPVTGKILLSAADATFVGHEEDAGYDVSGAGDMDGDGTADVVIGAPGNDGGRGVAYVVLGPVSGTIDLALADGFLVGENSTDLAGISVADAGDVDADGLDDLLVGAGGNGSWIPSGPTPYLYAGAAYLVLGPVTGAVDLAAADAKLSGEFEDDLTGEFSAGCDYVGDYVSGAGDVDADGHDDVLVGAHLNDSNGTDSGAAYLVLGPVPRDIDLHRADAKLIGEHEFDYAGFSVSDAGDVDGDGHDDVLVGAPLNSEGGYDAGAAYLLLGPVTGRLGLRSADAKLVGEQVGDRAGGSVSSAGDVNGDGLADMIVGAPRKLTLDREGDPRSGPARSGGAYIVLGPVSGHVDLSLAATELVGVGAGTPRIDGAGNAVSSAGDEDGDGFDDIIVGAWRVRKGFQDSPGAVYVFSGARL